MYQDAYNTIQSILKEGSVIKSIEFYSDGSIMCRTTVPDKKMVAFQNINEVLEFIDNYPF